MTQKKIALVVGANGGIGGELAAALKRHGWQVHGLARQPRAGGDEATAPHHWIAGDAMRAEDVRRAAAGAALIVHAVNPPGYRDWERLVLPMLRNSIAAARAVGARIVLPGTVYNYGPETFPLVDEAAPQRPLTRKGAIRAQMEQALREAGADGVRSLIVRAGDFFGPRPGNNWFSQGLVKPGGAIKSITYPGAPGVGHNWAYLPDLAETVAQLLQREDRLGVFETFHFGGHWDADGTAMVGAIRQVLQQPALPVRSFPWAILTLLAPFKTLFREMREMRYLWRQPLQLDNRRLVDWLGAEPHTPLELAVRRTLDGLSA
jgi:nucleoside-diphosphate-sugar epimerase